MTLLAVPTNFAKCTACGMEAPKGAVHGEFKNGNYTECNWTQITRMPFKGGVTVKSKRKITGSEPEEKKKQELTYGLHNDDRETLVTINEQLFRLVPHETYRTVKDLCNNYKGKELPHVRLLSPIMNRTPEEQAKANADSDFMHSLTIKYGSGSRPDKVTSVSKDIEMGANVPDEIKKLLEKKKTATPEEARKIRQQLRKLDYKRYAVTEGKK